MIGNWGRKTAYSFLLASCAIIVLSHQACQKSGSNPGDSTSTSASLIPGTTSKVSDPIGNGNGFEGKLHYAVNPEACKAQGKPGIIESAMELINGQMRIVRENCQDVAPKLVMSEEIYSSELNPQILGLDGKIFEERTVTPTFEKAGDNFLFIMCRAKYVTAGGSDYVDADGQIRVVKGSGSRNYTLRAKFDIALPPNQNWKPGDGPREVRSYDVNVVRRDNEYYAKPNWKANFVATTEAYATTLNKKFALTLFKTDQYYQGQVVNGNIRVPYESQDGHFYIHVKCDTVNEYEPIVKSQ